MRNCNYKTLDITELYVNPGIAGTHLAGVFILL